MDRIIKIGFTVLACFAIIFGFIRIGQQIRISFAPSSESESVAGGQQGADPLDEITLRVIDTDEDGLSDWDELYVYGTSPYLEDSDSDGVSDKEEIALGNDPNCPTGRVCGSGALEQATPQLPSASTADESERSGLGELLDPSSLAPDEIRQLLRDNGVTEEELLGVTDEQLLQLVQEASLSQENVSESSEQTIPANPTPDEVRVLLKQGGVTDEQLQGVSDEQLLEFYQETFANQ